MYKINLFNDLPNRVKKLKEPDIHSFGIYCSCDDLIKSGKTSVNTVMNNLKAYLNDKCISIKSSRQKTIRSNRLLKVIKNTLVKATNNGEQLIYCDRCNNVYYLDDKLRKHLKIEKKINSDPVKLEPIISSNSPKRGNIY